MKNRLYFSAVSIIFLFFLISSLFLIDVKVAQAQEGSGSKPKNPLLFNFPKIDVNINGGKGGEEKRGEAVIPEDTGVALPFQILAALSILTLAPYLLIMMTSFIRVAIVLSFIRSALGTQQVPPTQVLMGLAIFLTFFIMAPVGNKVNTEALQPFMKGEMQTAEFVNTALEPIRDFMFRQVREKDLVLFIKLAQMKKPKTKADVPIHVLIPAFMISEIKTAFEIGFAIYIPFLVVDMVVSSVLMSMGMFMLSPMTISMPFKLLLFVMVDGWGIIIESLVKSFK
ncbi:MAG: flagellar type III secretion system pore protein FliP [Candidatus Eremiobacterota bacterium]